MDYSISRRLAEGLILVDTTIALGTPIGGQPGQGRDGGCVGGCEDTCAGALRKPGNKHTKEKADPARRTSWDPWLAHSLTRDQ
jgi:hypothetical protein